MESQEGKSDNQYVDHVLSDEWDPYHYVMESCSAKKLKEKDVKRESLHSKGVKIEVQCSFAVEIAEECGVSDISFCPNKEDCFTKGM